MMPEAIYLITLATLFGTVLLVFAFKYGSAALQARAQGANDDNYRALAQRAVAAESEHAASVATIMAELKQVGARLGAIETILKQVE
jgi:predicted nucleic acid-binding protein